MGGGTDDKQRDRNHPFSFSQCRQSGQNLGGWVQDSDGGRKHRTGDSDGIQYSVFSNCSSTVTVSPSGPRKLFKGVTTAMSGVLQGFPGSSLSGTLLRVTGPLPSLVLRTEDIWQKRETNVIEVAGSQSGFPKKPFSPLMSTCAVSSKHKDAEHRPLVVWMID